MQRNIMFSDVYLRVERMAWPACRLDLLNTCGISLGVLFISEWPTQPHWLTCNECLLKNGMVFHSSLWPRLWGGAARLLWLCLLLSYKQGSIASMSCFFRLIIGGEDPPIHMLNSAAQPKNAFDWQMLHHLRGINHIRFTAMKHCYNNDVIKPVIRFWHDFFI